jgi:prepilin-type N-terminal cleavage/methylation domain-containing protein
MALPTTPPAEVRVATGAARDRHDPDVRTRSRVALRLLSVTSMRDHRGFTLIEVLVATVLIGVLAGIAIAQYASFRTRGCDSKIAAAVRGVATGEEAYYAENRVYASDVDDMHGMVIGDVAIAILPGNSGNLNSSFRVVGTHPGTTRRFTWLSDPAPGEPNLIED